MQYVPTDPWQRGDDSQMSEAEQQSLIEWALDAGIFDGYDGADHPAVAELYEKVEVALESYR